MENLPMTINGCVECPMYNNTGNEYGIWCQHPGRPVCITQYDGIPGRSNFLETNLPEEEREAIRRQFRIDQEEWIKRGEGDSIINAGDLCVDELPIYAKPPDYDPITPEWCPLKDSSLTIILWKAKQCHHFIAAKEL